MGASAVHDNFKKVRRSHHGTGHQADLAHRNTRHVVQAIHVSTRKLVKQAFFHHQAATGFVFEQPSGDALLSCIRRALLAYYECPVTFREMQQRGMQTRFTWQAAAEQYLTLYQSMG